MENSADIARNINYISELFNCTRGAEIMKGRVFSDTISQIKNMEDTDELPAAFTPILETITEHLSQFKRNSSLNFLPAVKWYLDHNMIAQGYTMLREGIVSFLIEQAKCTRNDRNFRDAVSNSLNYVGDIENNTFIDQKLIVNIRQIHALPIANKLRPVYREICKLRNDIDHAGMSWNSTPVNVLQDELTKYFFHVKDIVEKQERELSALPQEQDIFRFVGDSVGTQGNLRGYFDSNKRGSIAKSYFSKYSKHAGDFKGKELLVRIIGENPQRTGFLLDLVTDLDKEY